MVKPFIFGICALSLGIIIFLITHCKKLEKIVLKYSIEIGLAILIILVGLLIFSGDMSNLIDYLFWK